MNFQKMALFVFSKLVHALFSGHGFHGFVLIAIGKMIILAPIHHFLDKKKVIRDIRVGINQVSVILYNIPF